MNKPLVTVIMSVYNEEQFAKDAIQSILDQTYANFELIIIDDYSTDKSLDICKSFKDSRIRIYSKINEPRYLAASRNIAIEMAKGEYIINQDADDWSESTRIEKQLLKALENPGNRVVGCSIKRVENGIERIVKMPETHEDIIKGFKRLYDRATIVSGTILAPKKILKEIPYRVRFRYMQDWDHSLRLFESSKVQFYNCPEPLYTYYIRPKGVLFKPEWLDYNIYVRNCQGRRKTGLNEFREIEEFFDYLKKHPVERIKWFGLKKAIELKLRINQKRR
jgi:glycosyltransferase involved in cell wall biosynthesis